MTCRPLRRPPLRGRCCPLLLPCKPSLHRLLLLPRRLRLRLRLRLRRLPLVRLLLLLVAPPPLLPAMRIALLLLPALAPLAPHVVGGVGDEQRAERAVVPLLFERREETRRPLPHLFGMGRTNEQRPSLEMTREALQ